MRRAPAGAVRRPAVRFATVQAQRHRAVNLRGDDAGAGSTGVPVPARDRAERIVHMREVFQQELARGAGPPRRDRRARRRSRSTRRRGRSDESTSRLAEEVIADDARIDEKAVALDELAIEILARQQPVARDLRIVVSALRISASLERMGDIAEHIAQLARYRFPEQGRAEGPAVRRSPRWAQLDVEVARKLTELLRTEDLAHRRGDPQRRRQDRRRCTSASSTRCSARTGRARRSTPSTPRSPAATTSASPTTPSRSRRRSQYLATGDWTPETDALDV